TSHESTVNSEEQQIHFKSRYDEKSSSITCTPSNRNTESSSK
ncbi:unnamed protein product, partial [Rotaria magnacalcarata]